ncbi:DUF2964 family protein [Candidatus Parcubacteria bacterium]|jgi:hypothetical protein|nr:DUF2964 family protein [Candidatus Parcubacteria bacterium]
MNQTLYWIPRVFAIMFTLVVTLFVFDIEQFSWGALFMHLTPTIAVLIALLIAWKQEMIGGIIFIILGIVYIVMAWGDTPWLSFLAMSGPAFVIGILFLISKSSQSMAAPMTAPTMDQAPPTPQPEQPVEPQNVDSQDSV